VKAPDSVLRLDLTRLNNQIFFCTCRRSDCNVNRRPRRFGFYSSTNEEDSIRICHQARGLAACPSALTHWHIGIPWHASRGYLRRMTQGASATRSFTEDRHPAMSRLGLVPWAPPPNPVYLQHPWPACNFSNCSHTGRRSGQELGRFEFTMPNATSSYATGRETCDEPLERYVETTMHLGGQGGVQFPLLAATPRAGA
jgi:hypothetical protein